MLFAPSTSTRALIGGVAAAVIVALYTGCSSQGSERIGGGNPPDLTAGNGSSAGGDAGGVDGGAGGATSAAVPWCDAYKIINCVCQQCHQNPPLNTAPIPLLTYQDTQAPFPTPDSENFVWQTMQFVVGTRFMPYTGDKTVQPAVKPLSDEQQNTLLTWLNEGAHDLGGTDCPMTCDWAKGPPAAP